MILIVDVCVTEIPDPQPDTVDLSAGHETNFGKLL